MYFLYVESYLYIHLYIAYLYQYLYSYWHVRVCEYRVPVIQPYSAYSVRLTTVYSYGTGIYVLYLHCKRTVTIQ